MFDKTQPNLQIAFDNTSLALYKDCPRKYFYAIVEGWRPNAESTALTFGTLYHAGIEQFLIQKSRGVDHEAALIHTLQTIIPQSSVLGWGDSYRNPYTLIRAIVWYADHYRHDPLTTVILSSGKPALELSFRFELPITAPSNEPYFYCGHIDRIAALNGQTFCVDYKTTTSALTDSYFARYSPNAQISGYSYAAAVLFLQPTSGFIIDAMQLGVNFARPHRHVVPRTEEQLDEWLENTITWIKRIEQSAQRNSWPMNEESCTKYGSCQFREVCNKTPSVRDKFLASGFRRDRWNPLESR